MEDSICFALGPAGFFFFGPNLSIAYEVLALNMLAISRCELARLFVFLAIFENTSATLTVGIA